MSHTGFNTIGQDNLQLGNLRSLCQRAFERLNDTIENYARVKVGSEVVPHYRNFNAFIAAVQNGGTLCSNSFYGESEKELRRFSSFVSGKIKPNLMGFPCVSWNLNPYSKFNMKYDIPPSAFYVKALYRRTKRLMPTEWQLRIVVVSVVVSLSPPHVDR